MKHTFFEELKNFKIFIYYVPFKLEVYQPPLERLMVIGDR